MLGRLKKDTVSKSALSNVARAILAVEQLYIYMCVVGGEHVFLCLSVFVFLFSAVFCVLNLIAF